MTSLYDSMTYRRDWAITPGIPQSLSAFSLVTKLEKTENWHLGTVVANFQRLRVQSPGILECQNYTRTTKDAREASGMVGLIHPWCHNANNLANRSTKPSHHCEPPVHTVCKTDLIIVRRFRWPFVLQEKACVQWRRDLLERTRLLIKVEKGPQITVGAGIGKAQRAFADVENALDKFQDAAKVAWPDVIDVTLRGISGDDDQGHAKTVLIITFIAGEDGRLLVVVPASPVIPRNHYRGIGPISFPPLALGIKPYGVQGIPLFGWHPRDDWAERQRRGDLPPQRRQHGADVCQCEQLRHAAFILVAGT